MAPITIEHDGREWIAVGFKPDTGEFIWVPTDTEKIVAPLFDPADLEPETAAPEPAPYPGQLILPGFVR